MCQLEVEEVCHVGDEEVCQLVVEEEGSQVRLVGHNFQKMQGRYTSIILLILLICITQFTNKMYVRMYFFLSFPIQIVVF